MSVQRRGKTKGIVVSLLGPPLGGKTTFVRQIESGGPVLDDPHSTLGIDIRKKPVTIAGNVFRIIDLGGQEEYVQTYWEASVELSDGVIFVIDSTITSELDPEKFSNTVRLLDYVLDILPEQIPLLILLNKQDIEDKKKLDTEDLKTLFPVTKLKNHVVKFHKGSARYGDGIREAMTWISENIPR